MEACNLEMYTVIVLLVFKACTKLARALIEKHVKDTTPSGKLEDFLHDNMDLLFGREIKMKKCHRLLLFPKNGNKTNIESWDLELLCFIFLDICKPNSDVSMRINDLRDVRNRICHSNNADLDEGHYHSYLTKIKFAIQTCLKEINDETFEKEMNTLVENVESGKMCVDKEMELLEEWYKSERNIQDQLERLMNGQSQTHAKLDGVIQILGKLTEEHPELEFSIPDTEIKLYVKNCTPENKRLICETLVEMLDPKLRPMLKDKALADVYDAVREVMLKLLSDGKEVKEARISCVILRLRCPSFQSLIDLWENCVDGVITRMFQPVQNSIRKLSGFENAEIEVIVTNTEFWRCCEQIVKDISQSEGHNASAMENPCLQHSPLPEYEDIQSQIKSVVVEKNQSGVNNTFPHEENETCIKMNIKPTSVDQLIHILKTYSSGKLNRDLGKVSEAFKYVYDLDDCSIEAHIDEDTTLNNLAELLSSTEVQNESGQSISSVDERTEDSSTVHSSGRKCKQADAVTEYTHMDVSLNYFQQESYDTTVVEENKATTTVSAFSVQQHAYSTHKIYTQDEVEQNGATTTVSEFRVQQHADTQEMDAKDEAMAYSKGSVFEEPQCLIHTEANNRLVVDQAVLDQLAGVEEQLNVIAIAGLYRTGKSYLLTRLAGKYKGFDLGSTVCSKTKGIWAWCVKHPVHADQMLLLLDTEGLGGVEKGDQNHDNHIFTLATLLSSTLVYNMTGVLNYDAILKLKYPLNMVLTNYLTKRKYVAARKC